MEFPLRLTRVERALALVLMLPVLYTARLEQRSAIAAAARQGKPWTCWLALKARDNALPQIFLVYYRPARRSLELIYVAENVRLEDSRTLPQVAAAARKTGARTDAALADAMARAARGAVAGQAPDELREALSPGPAHLEEFEPDDVLPPLAAKDWLRSRLSAAEALRRLFWRPSKPGTLRGFERLRAGLELAKLKSDQLRAAYLPEEPEQRAVFFARLEEPAAGAPPGPGGAERPTTVEVLNATATSGIANSVKKILRSRGADVMATGNAPATGRTLVIDRVGRPELAARVRTMLDCPSAQALTQVDEKRLVDVSVVIADDCASRE